MNSRQLPKTEQSQLPYGWARHENACTGITELKYFEGMKMMNSMMKMNGTMDDMGMEMSNQTMDMNNVMYPELTGDKN